jgi:hypothetical protein
MALAVTLVAFGLIPPAIEAGTINFVDLTDSVSVNSPDFTLTKMPDSSGELLHITYTSTVAAPGGPFLSSRDLIERKADIDPVNNPINSPSDRLLVTLTLGSKLIDLKFGSDPDLPPQGTTIGPSVAENGKNQELIDYTPGGVIVDRFFVQSDIAPEPSTWLLLATGLVGLIGYGWRRRKKAAQA